MLLHLGAWNRQAACCARLLDSGSPPFELERLPGQATGLDLVGLVGRPWVGGILPHQAVWVVGDGDVRFFPGRQAGDFETSLPFPKTVPQFIPCMGG